MALTDDSNNPVLLMVGRAMNSIGYHGKLLRHDYDYFDITGSSHSVHRVALAGFAQSFPTYRDACIGVIVSNGISGAAHVAQHRALGAPMIFEIRSETLDRWKVTESGLPERMECISHDQIENAFAANESYWNPERVVRAKAIRFDLEPVQLDFVDIGLMPALEGIIHKKLDRLLNKTLTEIIAAHEQLIGRQPSPDYLFSLVFRFIAAKVFRDRGVDGGWHSDDAFSVLKAIESYYNVPSTSLLRSPNNNRDVLDYAWRSIKSAFHFQNLSVDDLAFIYENTLITRETRRALGTHSTPPEVAQYMVRKLPLQDLPVANRHVLEPFSGGGMFLLTAMRRLRELLPPNMPDVQRHEYFVKHLAGIERDQFALEVCRLSLMLADYPNPDGWRLHNDDVFTAPRLTDELNRADIVLCNPPFEDFTPAQLAQYGRRVKFIQRPAELLRRIMIDPPKLLGVILPLRFRSNSPAYRDAHSQLAGAYGKVELIEMPEVFAHSDARPVLLLASDRREQNARVAVICRTVKKETLDELFKHGKEPPATTEIKSVSPDQANAFSLWVPRLSRIWSYLEEYPKLESVAVIHQGVHWKGRAKRAGQINVISDIERPGYIKGLARVRDCLMQYRINGEQYLSLRPQDQYDNAYKLSWNQPKVACNAARLRRGPWRIGAVADSAGLAFSKRFFALWPSGSISINALAAILNSPVANAYSFAKDQERDNRIETLRSLPMPSLDHLALNGKLHALSQELHSRIGKARGHLIEADSRSLRSILLRIDAEILKAYDLPPVLERELLDTFQGIERPVPFEFNGYYPRGFRAYLPLEELVSEEFTEARADQLLERLSPVYDRKISEMLTWLNEE